jgi:hypothetical protein
MYSTYELLVNAILAVPWLRRLVTGLLPRRPGFAPGSVYMGFVVDEVALGQAFLPALWVFPVSITPPWRSVLIYYVGMNNSSVGVRSSGT